jgi:hypothetical protein
VQKQVVHCRHLIPFLPHPPLPSRILFIRLITDLSFLDTMAARLGYAQPDPRYPLANPPMPQQYPQQYQQRRRDYDAESDMSDPFGSRNTSTTHLTGNSPYHDHAGQYDHSESPVFLCPRLLSALVPFLAFIYYDFFLVPFCRPSSFTEVLVYFY